MTVLKVLVYRAFRADFYDLILPVASAAQALQHPSPIRLALR